MNAESVRFLFDYTYWASDQMWGCIMQLTDAQFTEPIDFSQGPIRNHIVHMMSAGRRWFERLQGKPAGEHLNFADYPTRESARAKWDDIKAESLAYVYSLDDAQVAESVPWALPQRQLSGNAPRWQILLQVANHSTDHRTQIMTLLHTHFHVSTVEQDLIFYAASRTDVGH